MSEPIKSGDLVMIVRGCAPQSMGAIFQVKALAHREVYRCKFCGQAHVGMYALANGTYDDGCDRAPLAWLKRIPPLSELEGEKRREEIEA